MHQVFVEWSCMRYELWSSPRRDKSLGAEKGDELQAPQKRGGLRMIVQGRLVSKIGDET